MNEPLFETASPKYRAIGLEANPFRLMRPHDGIDDAANVVCHVEAIRFVRALEEETGSDRPRPIWVSKAARTPDFYSRVSLGEILSIVPANKNLDVLLCYVPFFMMRQGRIRSALSMVAERLAGENFGRTLGLYAADAFGDPDAELLDKAGIDADTAAGLAERFAADPEATAEVYFGSDTMTRESGPNLDRVIRESSLRRWDMDMDPEKDEEQSDDTPMVVPDAFSYESAQGAPIDSVDMDEHNEEDAGEDQEARLAASVYDYLLDHARKHISPVVARGLAKYAAEGSYALCEELKLTKGPRKTLAAVTKLASYQYRKVVLLYDQFDSWRNAPVDLRLKIAGSLAEIRMMLGANGIVAIMAGAQELDEIRGQYTGANDVEWEMAPFFDELDADTGIQPSLLEYAIDAVAIDDESAAKWKVELAEKGVGTGDELLDSYGQIVDDAAASVDA